MWFGPIIPTLLFAVVAWGFWKWYIQPGWFPKKEKEKSTKKKVVKKKVVKKK